MVSFNVFRSTASGAYVEGVCLATDEKPVTGIANGSILYAVDASDGSTTRYMYDQNSMSWIEAACPCGGGSGGSGGGDSGGGGANVLVVPVENVSSAGDPIITATKTAGEMYAADVLVVTSSFPDGAGEDQVLCYEKSRSGEFYQFSFPTNLVLYAASADDYPTNVVPDDPGGAA